jgi:hypothetical protein
VYWGNLIKPVGDEIRAPGIAEANNNYRQADLLRMQLIKFQEEV